MRRAEEEGKTGFTTHPQQTRRLHGFKINDLDFADGMALMEELLERVTPAAGSQRHGQRSRNCHQHRQNQMDDNS